MLIAAPSVLIADISPSVRAFAALLAIMVAFAVFLGIAMILKRTLFSDDKAIGEEFSLADLRTLYDEGKLSDVEYEAAKHSVLDRIKKQDEKQKKTHKSRKR